MDEAGGGCTLGSSGQPIARGIPLDKPVETKSQTSQVNKTMDGDSPVALIISQTKMLFQITNSQFNGEASGINFNDLSDGQTQVG